MISSFKISNNQITESDIISLYTTGSIGPTGSTGSTGSTGLVS